MRTSADQFASDCERAYALGAHYGLRGGHLPAYTEGESPRHTPRTLVCTVAAKFAQGIGVLGH
eukprot:2141361-Pleurochrysis_carterae.AAC.1